MLLLGDILARTVRAARPGWVLGLDLANVTGWATWCPEYGIRWGTWDFRPGPKEGYGWRFLRLRRELTELRRGMPGDPCFVGYELVDFLSRPRRKDGSEGAPQVTSLQVQGGYRAMATSWCEAYGVPYEGVSPIAVKKLVTGKGNAKKADMIEAWHALNKTPANHNEADALGVLLWGLETTERLYDGRRAA